MNTTQALDIHLSALVAVHGLQRVQKALARIDEHRVEKLDEFRVNDDDRGMHATSAKRTRRKKGIEALIQEADIDPSVRLLVQEIGHAYERKDFLPDLWRVRKFLESEGVEASKLRSRSDALRKIIDVLACQTDQRLKELLADSKCTRGELATLTDQILGEPIGRSRATNPEATD